MASLPYQQQEQLPTGGWDVFLSHSGEQKGFAKDLFRRLSPPYSVFFDINRPSLPLGEPFPPRIFEAAKTCKVALVVLSDKFFCSKWPMLELCTFFETRGVKVLPLFYKLSPKDLKDKFEEWCKRWMELESEDGRFNASLCFNACRRLQSINGPTFEESNGCLPYLDEIALAISLMIPHPISFSPDVVHGRDRLCKVLIDKFSQMERWPQNPSADLSRVLVLGVYGFSGSGKTTLCECLCDHYHSSFPGRALHLELPSNASPKQLLETFEKLLKLTDWGRNRGNMMMSELKNFPTMVKVFKDSNLRSLKMFLVIDNITSKSSEAVVGILQAGIGAGSRVMLVARTREILCPLLKLSRNTGNHVCYVRDQLRVPSLNKEEAISMLLQHACGHEMVEEYSASHREIIAKAAYFCAFYDGSWSDHHMHQTLLYLPLVLKIVGGQLNGDGLDLKELKRQLLRRKTAMLRDLKENAVAEILSKSYQNLPENLKLLFFDAVFFIILGLRSSTGIENDLELLGCMHECSSETVIRELKTLRRLGFLEGSDNAFSVHDLLMDYATSLRSSSFVYYFSRRNSAREQVMHDLLKNAVGLRALVLEVDEKCERFDFPVGLLSVKVVVVRACKSLAVLGLAGLTSLVSLEIEDCPSLKRVELDPSHEYTLKRVRWANLCDQEGIITQSQQGSSQMVQAGSGRILQLKCLMSRLWCNVSALRMWHRSPPLSGFVNIASQVKALQVLRLEKTGIRSLGDLSSCWPQLRVLEVLEGDLDILELGNLPDLKQFFYGNCSRHIFLDMDAIYELDREELPDAKMLRNPNLLAGCPQLEDVRICGPSYEDGMCALRLPPHSRILLLKNIYTQGDQPGRLEFTSSAHLLEEIVIDHHSALEGLEFSCQILNLVCISLCGCPNVITITGLECLPMLQSLKVEICDKLQALQNLEALSMLESLDLSGCPMLTIPSLALSSQHLHTINVFDCPNMQFQASNLEKLTALCYLVCKVSGRSLNLKNLVKLETVKLDWVCVGQAKYYNPMSLCSYDDELISEQVINSTSAVDVQGIQRMSLLVVSGSVVPPLSEFCLEGVQNLSSLDGIHCLSSIRTLHLEDLPRLANLASLDGISSSVEDLSLSFLPKMTCLQRLESLTNLKRLFIKKCEAIKELPSLCTLVNLCFFYITDCVNLVRLEGLHSMRSLTNAEFSRCESLEHLNWDSQTSLEQLSFYNSACSLSFKGCYKLASIEAMLGWVLAEKVSNTLLHASWDALIWELTDHLLEKPEERKGLAEQLVETLGVCLTKKCSALTQCGDCLDFQPWVHILEKEWGFVKLFSEASFPRELRELMGKLGRVPVKEVVQQCQSDAHFRASVADCILQTHPEVFRHWIHEIYQWSKRAIHS